MRILVPAALVAVMSLSVAQAEDLKRADVVAMYEKAAGWYLKTQNPNGSWGMIPGNKEPGELGITGLTVAGLAKAPEELRAKYREACGKAATWILKNQQEDGSFAHERSGLTTYRTALSIQALQAYDSVGNKAAIDKAVKWLKETQFCEDNGVPESDVNYGGWGYDKKGTKPDADLSNASMALQALKDAGIPETDPVYKRAVAFLTRCQNNSETNKGAGKIKAKDDGGFYYDPGLSSDKSVKTENPDGTISYESYAGMTYTGLMSLLYAQVGKDDPRVKAAMGWISKNFDLERNTGLGVRNPKPNADQQGLFYYYMSFAKCLDTYGEKVLDTAKGKVDWVQALAQTLKARQKPEGFWINEGNDRWWEGNPLIPTCYMFLALNRVLENMPAPAK